MQISVNHTSPIILGGNWWNILIVLETIEEQKKPERSSYAILKQVVWLYSVTSFLITFQKKHESEKAEAKLKKSWWSKQSGHTKQQASEKLKATYLSPAKSSEWRIICIQV